MRRALVFSLVLLSAGAAAQIPVLHVSPVSLAFVLDGRSPAAPQQVRIRNVGSGTLRWTARPAEPWIRVSPQSGSGPAVLTVEIDGAKIAPGRHEGRISIDAGDADDSPASVAISVESSAAPPAGQPARQAPAAAEPKAADTASRTAARTTRGTARCSRGSRGRSRPSESGPPHAAASDPQSAVRAGGSRRRRHASLRHPHRRGPAARRPRALAEDRSQEPPGFRVTIRLSSP